MKKIYSLAIALGFFGQVGAQVLNQSAAWPNAAWTITGNYNTDPLAFEASPITTANFAFDDDDATNGHEDNIAAESPVIDLTAAFAANEKSVEITVEYGYYYLADDVLQFQYWNADTAVWTAWPGANIAGNTTSIYNDFCTVPKTVHITPSLDIAGFTATQLAGFKYRISYDDNITGADWNYGFCFNSPTIKSVGCAAVSGLAVANLTSSTADITWGAVTGAAGYEYVLDNSAANPASGIETTDTFFDATLLSPSTVYYFHIRTNCGGSYSDWRMIQFTTPAEVPANDSCETAIAIASFPYTNTQDASAATNNGGFITACVGTNDGVWYTFVGNGSDVVLSCENVIAWDPRMVVYTGSCGTFTCVGQIDNGGWGGSETYTVTSSVAGTTYYINIGYYSGFGDSPEGPFSLNATSTSLGGPSFNNDYFTSYPNPVTNYLNLSYIADIKEVAVFNLLGQQVLSKSVNAREAQVDMSSLSQGTYMVKVISGQESKTIKIVKQ